MLLLLCLPLYFCALYPGSISIQTDHALNYCSYVPNPVLVIIDVEPKELGIPTKAYYAVEEVKEVGLKSLIPMIELLNFYFYWYYCKNDSSVYGRWEKR